MMKQVLTYTGTAISLAAFVTSFILSCEKWLLSLQPSENAIIITLIAVIVLIFPLVNSIRYEESDLQPLIKPSRPVKIISRAIAFSLFIFAIVDYVVILNKPQNERDDAVFSELALAFLLFASWLSLALYVFGLKVFFSEKYIAISRNLIFLFRPDLLDRYLKDKGNENDSEK